MTSSVARNGRPAPRAAHRPAPARTPEAAGPADAPEAGERQGLGSALQELLVVAVDRLAGAAADTIDGLVGKLDGLAVPGGSGGGGGKGVLAQAAVAGGLAWVQGGNPVWAALKGGVSAMSTATKVGLALLLIVTAVLAPVLVLVLAVVLLLAAVVGAIAS